MLAMQLLRSHLWAVEGGVAAAGGEAQITGQFFGVAEVDMRNCLQPHLSILPVEPFMVVRL